MSSKKAKARSKPEVKRKAKRRSSRKPVTLKNVRAFISRELRNMERDKRNLRTLLKASKRLG